MSRLVLKMSMSLDGFVGGPIGELADILSSFDQEATDCLSPLRRCGAQG